MYCHECGANNADTSRFCLKCGTRLVKSEPSAPTAEPFALAPTSLDRLDPQSDMPTVVRQDGEPFQPPFRPTAQRFPTEPASGPQGDEQPTEWAWPTEPRWEEDDYAAPIAEAPTEVPRTRRRRFPRALFTCGVVALILILVFVAAVVAAWFWLGLHRTNQTVRLIPDDSAMVVSFSPDPRQALQFRDVANLEALVPLLAVVPGLFDIAGAAQAEAVADLGVDFRSDVLPWIGREASIAVLDVASTGDRDVPPILLSLATRSETRSDEFLGKVRDALEGEGFTFEEETYRGTHVVYQVPRHDGAFAPAFATTSHLVLVGTDLDTLHSAIDASQSNSRSVLADSEAYREILGKLPSNRLGYVYVDGKTFLTQLAREGSQTEGLAAIEGVGAAFKLSSRGLMVDYVLRYDTGEMSRSREQAMQRPPTQRLTASMLPEDALAYWSEQDAQMTWRGLLDTLRSIEDLGDAIWDVDSTIQEINAKTGFDVDSDLLSDLTGEYALALVPDRTGFPGSDEAPLGLVLMAEVTRPNRTRSTLGDLGEALVYAGIVSSFPIEERDITLMDTGAGWTLAYGFVDDYLVIGSSPAAVEAALDGKDAPLAGARLYRDALARLPGEARGYLFVDASSTIDAILKGVSAYDRDLYESDLKPYLESLEGVGLSLGSMDEDGLVRGTLVILTK